MKNKSIRSVFVPGLLTLALALIVPPAAAQDNTPPKEKAPSKADLKKYDANGDGRLDEGETARKKAEAKAKRDAQKAQELAKYDADRDGKLSPEEKAQEKSDKQAAKEAKQAAKERGGN
jgi:EF hand